MTTHTDHRNRSNPRKAGIGPERGWCYQTGSMLQGSGLLPGTGFSCTDNRKEEMKCTFSIRYCSACLPASLP